MTKVAILLVVLFVGSVLSIAAGYANFSLGLDWMAVKWVYESIPVVRLSLMLVLLFIFDISLSFMLSKGSFDRFRNEFYGLSIFVPAFALLAVAPGAAEAPDYLAEHYLLMLALVVLLHIGLGSLLFTEFWHIGGRDFDQAHHQSDVSDDVNNSFDDLFTELEHLSYVLECLSTDAQGEAKYELEKLVSSLETWSGCADVSEAVVKLKDGSDYLRENRARDAAVSISQASRVLWKCAIKE